MSESKPKIFGIGLSKTGTTSLAAALRRLGYRVNDFPYDHQTREEIEQGHYHLSILGEYDAITDIPAAPFYAQYDKCFPGSKFVLTVRDHESWLSSIANHWAFTDRWANERRYPEDFTLMSYFIRTATYGLTKFHADRYRQVYDKHVTGVMDYFANRLGDFLVMDVCGGEGYEKLCPFLDRPVPDEPFPLSNAREIRISREDWLNQFRGLVSDLSHCCKDGQRLLMIESQQYEDSPLTDRWKVLTLGKTSALGECPVDDRDALARLHQSLNGQVGAVVLPWTAFWWPDHFPQLFARLKEISGRVVQTKHAIIYRIGHSSTQSAL